MSEYAGTGSAALDALLEDAAMVEELRECLRIAHAAALQGGYVRGEDEADMNRVRVALGAKGVLTPDAHLSEDGSARFASTERDA